LVDSWIMTQEGLNPEKIRRSKARIAEFELSIQKDIEATELRELVG
jgi:hypothetical protein